MINVYQAGLDALYLFGRMAKGDPGDTFDESKPIKWWKDFNPVADVTLSGPLGEDLVKYEGYRINKNATGVERFTFFLTADQAKRSNIPPGGFTSTSKSPLTEVPFPTRAIEVGESLHIGMGGVIEVRNDALYKEKMGQFDTSAPVFSSDDRQVLNTILRLQQLSIGQSGGGGGVDNSAQLNRIEAMLGNLSIRLGVSTPKVG